MNLIDTTILGIVEGLTEFLPISSTGHMILTSDLLKLQNEEFLKTFEISIQLGAILAIVFLYARKFLKNTMLYKKLAAAFIPTAAIGFLFYKIIKTYLFNPIVVSVALILGGVVLILLDKRIVNAEQKNAELENISYRNAFFIGLFQSISVIPGVSRAAATIIGGVLNGFNKKQATEFSFLLAVPTMLAATGYNLLKVPGHFTPYEWLLLGLGSLISFISAWVAVKLLLKFIEKHGFSLFGYYRIVLGLLFLWIHPTF
jgi:undecaprenyl-diphosphatase